MRHSRLHFIVLMLTNHKVHALRIILAQRFAKGLHLVVFTAKAHHQHRPGVRMANHILQHGAGIEVIVPELRAAIGMAEEMHPIDVLRAVCLFQKTVLHLAGHGVDAADGR